ncbi:MAG: hypothetical protein U9Q40_00865, partial [Campylobacterota bacterium]|nr:hypothetical protein [Campylobacterota bacterium]
IVFEKIIISNAVCFKYSELLNALNHMDDLEYGYEMAYKYKDDNLCEYFSDRGVSYEAQNFAKMKISALKGDIKELRKAVSNGADIEALDIEFIVEVINENQVESLKYLYDSGLVITIALSRYLNEAMSQHKAYETISYLIELGLDISAIKSMPREYKKSYPLIADMREKRLSNIFDYTVFLAREVYPNTKGKEKEAVIQRIAELSALPYVIKRSGGKST